MEALAFNWVEDAGGLPPAIHRLAGKLKRKGHTESAAIAIAVAAAKRFAPDHPAWAKAVGQWEAMRASARAHDFDPGQARDADGKWTDEGGVAFEKGDRIQLAGGIDPVTRETVAGPIRGRIARQDGDRVMINAGTPTKPKWVAGKMGDAARPVRQQTGPVGAANPRVGWAKRLTDRERKAVVAYKENGYRKVNSHLRGQTEAGSTVKDRIEMLDAALEKGALGRPTRLFRAFRSDHVIANFDTLEGTTFTDQGFLSTSESEGEPLKIAQSHRAKGQPFVIARMDVPAGTPAGFLDTVKKLDEREVLLPRGLGFRVAKAYTDSHGQRYVDLELEAAA